MVRWLPDLEIQLMRLVEVQYKKQFRNLVIYKAYDTFPVTEEARVPFKTRFTTGRAWELAVELQPVNGKPAYWTNLRAFMKQVMKTLANKVEAARLHLEVKSVRGPIDRVPRVYVALVGRETRWDTELPLFVRGADYPEVEFDSVGYTRPDRERRNLREGFFRRNPDEKIPFKTSLRRINNARQRIINPLDIEAACEGPTPLEKDALTFKYTAPATDADDGECTDRPVNTPSSECSESKAARQRVVARFRERLDAFFSRQRTHSLRLFRKSSQATPLDAKLVGLLAEEDEDTTGNFLWEAGDRAIDDPYAGIQQRRRSKPSSEDEARHVYEPVDSVQTYSKEHVQRLKASVEECFLPCDACQHDATWAKKLKACTTLLHLLPWEFPDQRDESNLFNLQNFRLAQLACEGQWGARKGLRAPVKRKCIKSWAG